MRCAPHARLPYGREQIDEGAHLGEAHERKLWTVDQPAGRGRGLGHPDRQERQGLVGLANDEVIGAGVTLGADHGNDLAAAGVERIRDPNLNRRTPGSMTLVRPARASRIWPWRWGWRRSRRGGASTSPRWPTSLPRWPRRSGRGACAS